MSLYDSLETPDGVEYDVEWVTPHIGINISHLFVPPPLRRNNRGRETVETILSAASDDGAEYAVVNIGGGESSARFLEDLGFEIVELESNHVTAIADPIEATLS